MVLIKENTRAFLNEIVLGLEKQIGNVVHSRDLEKAFIYWLNPDGGLLSKDFCEIVEAASKAAGAQRTHREVAILGYASVIDRDLTNNTALVSGLKWIIGRQAFAPNGTPSFEIDGMALLGIALGSLRVPTPQRQEVVNWMTTFLSRTASTKLDSLTQTLISMAAIIIERRDLAPFRDEDLPKVAVVVLKSKGYVDSIDDVEEVALVSILKIESLKENAPGAALRFSALKYLMQCLPNIDMNNLGIDDVIKVLSRLQHSLKRWTWENVPRTGRKGASSIKWEIENEYHLQNLLWTVLAPIFPGLDDEENIKSSGPAKPRADLCIPSMRLVIEAKFMRDGTQSEQSRMINELAADASLYCVPGSGFTGVIPVIWDNSRTVEHHTEMIQGLEAIENVVKAFIISRPGRMTSSIENLSRARKKVAKKAAKKKSVSSKRKR